MLFLIYRTDKPHSEDVRATSRQEHYAFMDAHAHKVVLGGGILAQDGVAIDGSIILLEASSRDEVEAFLERDPFTSVGLSEQVVVKQFRLAYLDHEKASR
jgi:uncharacterized protein